MPFALKWEEELLCKQVVVHLDVMVHKDSSWESGVTPLAELMLRCISASVSALQGRRLPR